ncbi:MAG: type II toxin-antitoxin system RelE/ParE family toxin [Gammaproteobacteria bacterium]
MWKIYTAPEFDKWFSNQTEKEKQGIRGRISKIELQGHFGEHKTVSDNNIIWELKWKNGRRVYYAYLQDLEILLLLGGNKNGQTKDIREAKKIYKKYE